MIFKMFFKWYKNLVIEQLAAVLLPIVLKVTVDFNKLKLN